MYEHVAAVVVVWFVEPKTVYRSVWKKCIENCCLCAPWTVYCVLYMASVGIIIDHRKYSFLFYIFWIRLCVHIMWLSMDYYLSYIIHTYNEPCIVLCGLLVLISRSYDRPFLFLFNSEMFCYVFFSFSSSLLPFALFHLFFFLNSA